MSEAVDELPPSPDSPSGDLETLVSELGSKRAEFFATIDEYASRPKESQYDTVVDAAEKLTDAFRGTLKQVYKDPLTTDDAKARIGASLLVEDGRARISHFKQLLPEADLKRQPETWDEIYANLLLVFTNEDDDSDRNDYPYVVTSMHEFDLITDLEQFAQSCGKTWRAKAERVGYLLLGHGLDIAKTAIGTGIGAGIAIYAARH
jgi:hypothetical protein